MFRGVTSFTNPLISIVELTLRSFRAAASIFLVEEKLALQVVLLHYIAVDNADPAQTGTGEQLGLQASQRAATDDQDAGLEQLLLPRGADFFQHPLSRIPVVLHMCRLSTSSAVAAPRTVNSVDWEP
jgi:hypothetical protein